LDRCATGCNTQLKKRAKVATCPNVIVHVYRVVGFATLTVINSTEVSSQSYAPVADVGKNSEHSFMEACME
jgi:hypothetical protein